MIIQKHDGSDIQQSRNIELVKRYIIQNYPDIVVGISNQQIWAVDSDPRNSGSMNWIQPGMINTSLTTKSNLYDF